MSDTMRFHYNTRRTRRPINPLEVTIPGRTDNISQRTYNTYSVTGFGGFDPGTFNDSTAIYIDGIAGNDLNNGNQATPVQTFERACQLITATRFTIIITTDIKETVTLKADAVATNINIISDNDATRTITAADLYSFDFNANIDTDVTAVGNPQILPYGKGDYFYEPTSDKFYYVLPDLRNDITLTLVGTEDGKNYTTLGTLAGARRNIKSATHKSFNNALIIHTTRGGGDNFRENNPFNGQNVNQALYASLQETTDGTIAIPTDADPIQIPGTTAGSTNHLGARYRGWVYDVCRNLNHPARIMACTISTVTTGITPVNTNADIVSIWTWIPNQWVLFDEWESEDKYITATAGNLRLAFLYNICLRPAGQNVYWFAPGRSRVSTGGDFQDLENLDDALVPTDVTFYKNAYYIATYTGLYRSDDGVRFWVRVLDTGRAISKIGQYNEVLIVNDVNPDAVGQAPAPGTVTNNPAKLHYTYDGIKWKSVTMGEAYYGNIFHIGGIINICAGSRLAPTVTHIDTSIGFQEAVVAIHPEATQSTFHLDNIEISGLDSNGNKARATGIAQGSVLNGSPFMLSHMEIRELYGYAILGETPSTAETIICDSYGGINKNEELVPLSNDSPIYFENDPVAQVTPTILYTVFANLEAAAIKAATKRKLIDPTHAELRVHHCTIVNTEIGIDVRDHRRIFNSYNQIFSDDTTITAERILIDESLFYSVTFYSRANHTEIEIIWSLINGGATGGATLSNNIGTQVTPAFRDETNKDLRLLIAGLYTPQVTDNPEEWLYFLFDSPGAFAASDETNMGAYHVQTAFIEELKHLILEMPSPNSLQWDNVFLNSQTSEGITNAESFGTRQIRKFQIDYTNTKYRFNETITHGIFELRNSETKVEWFPVFKLNKPEDYKEVENIYPNWLDEITIPLKASNYDEITVTKENAQSREATLDGQFLDGTLNITTDEADLNWLTGLWIILYPDFTPTMIQDNFFDYHMIDCTDPKTNKNKIVLNPVEEHQGVVNGYARIIRAIWVGSFNIGHITKDYITVEFNSNLQMKRGVFEDYILTIPYETDFDAYIDDLITFGSGSFQLTNGWDNDPTKYKFILESMKNPDPNTTRQWYKAYPISPNTKLNLKKLHAQNLLTNLDPLIGTFWQGMINSMIISPEANDTVNNANQSPTELDNWLKRGSEWPNYENQQKEPMAIRNQKLTLIQTKNPEEYSPFTGSELQ